MRSQGSVSRWPNCGVYVPKNGIIAGLDNGLSVIRCQIFIYASNDVSSMEIGRPTSNRNTFKIQMFYSENIFKVIFIRALFTEKTPSYGYRDPHYKAKTVWRPFQVYNGNPYTDKTASS